LDQELVPISGDDLVNPSAELYAVQRVARSVTAAGLRRLVQRCQQVSGNGSPIGRCCREGPDVTQRPDVILLGSWEPAVLPADDGLVGLDGLEIDPAVIPALGFRERIKRNSDRIDLAVIPGGNLLDGQFVVPILCP
jgi:hypothetical protein